MDFLNKTFAQLKELFAGMTPAARITSALLLAVVVVSLGYLFTAGTRGGNVYLLDNRAFTSTDLQLMEAAFAQEGLGDYEIVAGKVRVPHGKQTDYTAALAKHNALPRDFGAILDKAINDSSPWSTRDQRQSQRLHARAQELSKVISKMDSRIDRAAVFYDEEIKPGLGREKTATASVNVEMLGSYGLDEALAASIAQTIAAAYAPLKPEGVVVSDNHGNSFHGPAGEGAGALGGTLASETKKQEREYTKKIANLMTFVPGARVSVNVELHPESYRRERQITPDSENKLALTTRETKTKKTLDRPNAGGRPGYVAQGNTARSLATTQSSGTKEDETQSEFEETVAPSGVESEKEYAPFAVKRVRVAIAVPSSHFEMIWRARNPSKKGEDPKTPPQTDLDQIRTETEAKIKQLAAGVLPPVEGVDDLTQLVEVTDFQNIPPEPVPQPGITAKATGWLAANWAALGLIGLGAFSLVMLRSMLKVVPGGGPGQPLAPAFAETEATDAENNTQQDRKLVRFGGSGQSLKDELSSLVTEDADAAANILKNWIGSGATNS